MVTRDRENAARGEDDRRADVTHQVSQDRRATTMITPPIVGVPALTWCVEGPSSRIC